jgi:hypothetical protein
LDFHAQLAKRRIVKLFKRSSALPLVLFAAALAGGGALYAQLEGADRGIPPIESATTLEVTGVEVDVTADGPQKAREEGWRRAQALGWRALWAKTNGQPPERAPALSDSVLNSLVSGIIIEQEQIGPRRYVARLGVLFDRARTGQLLGLSGYTRRSQPMLVIPVMVTGSTPYSFEFRNPWQAAWARFRTANSPIDYVRPTGSGVDPLLLNQAQARRPGRGLWRMILDQYGAADIVLPEVQLKRLYPGGPTIGTFTARYGPDNQVLGRFSLRVENSGAIPRLLDEGVRRLDLIYSQALEQGQLRSDPTLLMPEPEIIETAAQQIAEAPAAERPAPQPTAPQPTVAALPVTIQVATPNATVVQQAEIAVSSVRGVTSALTTERNVGGTSTMQVTFAGDPAELQAALQAQGWVVSGSGSSLRISRPGGPE